MAGIFKRRKDDQPQFFATVGEGLKKIYKAKLLPLEEAYDFHDFVSPQLNDPDFDAKPMILFVGQYSTGRSLLKCITILIPTTFTETLLLLPSVYNDLRCNKVAIMLIQEIVNYGAVSTNVGSNLRKLLLTSLITYTSHCSIISLL